MKNSGLGFLAAAGSFIMWGLLPIYWKQVEHISSLEVLSYRVAGAMLFVWGYLWIRKGLSPVWTGLRNPRTALMFLLSAAFLTTNWFIFIWAVNSGQIVEASMGYFINPLLNVLLGVVLLRERLGKLKGIAVGLAFIGVAYMARNYGRIPWIALLLAFTFAGYGLLRKVGHLESMAGLGLETLYVGPIALGYVFFLNIRGLTALGSDSTALVNILLVAGGFVTAIPLLLFGYGIRRLKLSTTGFIQYLAPVLQLLVGVCLYGEDFTRIHAVSFGFIWGGLILYSVASLRKSGKQA